MCFLDYYCIREPSQIQWHETDGSFMDCLFASTFIAFYERVVNILYTKGNTWQHLHGNKCLNTKMILTIWSTWICDERYTWKQFLNNFKIDFTMIGIKKWGWQFLNEMLSYQKLSDSDAEKKQKALNIKTVNTIQRETELSISFARKYISFNVTLPCWFPYNWDDFSCAHVLYTFWCCLRTQ